MSTRPTSPPPGAGTLDEQMAQLAKVKRLTYDAGWMRWGWPERVGGLGGSPLLRAYLGEALTARDLVEPGIYSMTEVLAPTMIDYARPALAADMVPRLLRGDETWCQGFSEPGPGSNLAALACRATRRPETAGGSPGRRSGRAWPSTPSAACSSPAPGPRTRPTAASPPCSSTWTAPASRCDPSRPCTAPPSSARCSSTTSPSPSTAPSAAEGQGWSVAMDLLPFERSTALWHRAPISTGVCRTSWTSVPADTLDPAEVGEVAQLSTPFGPGPGPPSTGWPPASASDRRPRSTRCWWPRPNRPCSTSSTRPGSRPGLGDDPDSARWRSEYLYSRAATIYGGTAEIQRNIIARRLLDLGPDR